MVDLSDLFLDRSDEAWTVFIAGAVGAGGVLASLLARDRSMVARLASTVLASGVAGGLAANLAVKDRNRKLLIERIEAAEHEVRSAVGIRPLTRLPVKLGGWAITASFLDRLVREIYLREPSLIVECGSGSSTIVAAACLRDLGQGRVVSLDHDEHYAQRTRALLALHDLDEWATVVTAPLRPYTLHGEEWLWYDFDVSAHVDQSIDMLVVDGPPEATRPLARYPAVPLLAFQFADDVFVILDDGDRADEEVIAHRWQEELGGVLTVDRRGRGFWVLER